MENIGLLTICFSAFITVFLALSLLAVVMRFIIILFPEKGADQDSALFAAITCSYNNLYPGTKITKIEEQK
jgi:hypothetical protein